ncbi:MAG: hypothetical protein QXG35_10295 [Nitrososphaerota archaeon]
MVKNWEKMKNDLPPAILLMDMGAGGSSLDNMHKAINLLVESGYRPIAFSAFQAAGGMTQAFALLIKA